MSLRASLLHALALFLGPILMVGVVNRTKSLWAGRKGPPILQTLYDLRRLERKRPVYASVAVGLVQSAPSVVLGGAVVSGFFVPLVGAGAPMSFPYDFVFFAYAWGLGRMFLMLGAMDTGSSFEGMGASREAAYSALIEPVFLLSVGTLAAATGTPAFCDLLRFRPTDFAAFIVWGGCAAALFLWLQVECARIPIDDPGTHLELTMIHEVMILDHSGPDLAALQYAAAIKLTLCSAVLAALANPLDPAAAPVSFAAANFALMFGLGVLVGTVESLIARLRLQSVPQYVSLGFAAAFVALLGSVRGFSGAG